MNTKQIKHILVVESSVHMSQVIGDSLRGHGCDVYQVSDAVQGLIQAGTNDYDVVTVSDQVQGMAPREFIAALQKISPNLKIIFITSKNLITNSEILKISKPLILADLWAAINENRQVQKQVRHIGHA